MDFLDKLASELSQQGGQSTPGVSNSIRTKFYVDMGVYWPMGAHFQDFVYCVWVVGSGTEKPKIPSRGGAGK